MNPGRLAVAFAAAAGVHLLVFQWVLPTMPSLTIASGDITLNVELLTEKVIGEAKTASAAKATLHQQNQTTQQQPRPAETVPAPIEMAKVPQQMSVPAVLQDSLPEEAAALPAFESTPVSHPEIAQEMASVQDESTDDSLASREDVSSESEQVSEQPESQPDSEPLAVPGDVGRMILAHVSYPRKARRKGWQGMAMFRLDVREQKLARLDLSRSSGFDLLDSAAMRGIRSVDALPLANGLYQLPVEFRLK